MHPGRLTVPVCSRLSGFSEPGMSSAKSRNCMCPQSCLTLCKAPLSMGFFRKEYWSRLPFPSPRDLLNPRIKPGSPALEADALNSEPPRKLQECSNYRTIVLISHASKVMLKILQARLQQYMNQKPEIKLPTSAGS